MQDLILFLICAYLASLGFLRLRRFYTAPLSYLQGGTVSSQAVRISVIIPARNEEHRLGPLLESLQNQTYKPYEILVVDDGSTDGTAQLARRFGCRLVQPADALSVAPLEAPGDLRWTGKSAACYAGAQEARGDRLVFFDADVALAPDALEYLACYSRPGAVLSVQPYHVMKRAYEQFSLYFNLVALLGLDLGQWRHPFDTKLGFFGPCMVIDRETYQATGGHLLVRDSILEDMALGQAFARLKVPLYSIPHRNRITFRMYAEGFHTLFNGWSKNMALGAQRSSLWTILIISSIITLSLSIPIGLIRSLAVAQLGAGLFFGAAYLVFAGVLFFGVRRIGAFHRWSSLCFPGFALFFVIVIVRSFAMQLLRLPIEWRGRRVQIK